MKKLIVLSLFIVLIVGCNKDPSSTNDNSTSLSPPSWIIGTWWTVPGGLGFTFISNDVINHMGDSSYSFVETFQQAPLTDVSSDIMYKIIIGEPGISTEYLFDKISSGSLNYTLIINNMVTGPVVMTKQ